VLVLALSANNVTIAEVLVAAKVNVMYPLDYPIALDPSDLRMPTLRQSSNSATLEWRRKAATVRSGEIFAVRR
jgi:hypothetical protein